MVGEGGIAPRKLASIEREVLTHNADGRGAPGLQILRAAYRVPESAHVPPGQCPRPVVRLVPPLDACPVVYGRRRNRHRSPPSAGMIRCSTKYIGAAARQPVGLA